MGGLALLARQLGHRVSGSDRGVYPPMSDQLEAQGIELREGYHAANLRPAPDLVIIGNALSRGNPEIEHALDEGLRYTSGPQWLSGHVLHGRHVLAVAGTHGKTTTSAMLAWILQHAGRAPGWLVGGVPENFGRTAALGGGELFVVEADEYDTAFFDKRSKFVHYGPRTLVLNNLEYDHADIFDSLEAIQRQFHHLVRTVPSKGLIITPHQDPALDAVLESGCFTPRERFGAGLPRARCESLAAGGAVIWNAERADRAGARFDLVRYGPDGVRERAPVRWRLGGRHNIRNALAAAAAARHAGVDAAAAARALGEFGGVKRRLELRGTVGGVRVFDDFAHHPTAIAAALEAMADRLAADGAESRLIAVIEPASNSMRMGVHRHTLSAACQAADSVVWFRPARSAIDFDALLGESGTAARAFDTVDGIVGHLKADSRPGDHIVIMSNGGFGGIHDRLLEALAS